ncbi:uncharacterized protein [Dysidea avara]|uniref:uncharacterized protein n=1 Tax=Dysidea avara TaxID=196820 RepID=UPI0033295BE4
MSLQQEDLKATIVAKLEEQKTWMAGQFKDISTQMAKQLHTIMVPSGATNATPGSHVNSTHLYQNVTDSFDITTSTATAPDDVITAPGSVITVTTTTASDSVVNTSTTNEEATNNDEHDTEIERTEKYLSTDELLTVFIKTQNSWSFAREVALNYLMKTLSLIPMLTDQLLTEKKSRP